MNKVVKMELSQARRARLAFPDQAYAVESVTAEGLPYTFATIYKNKHGRTNLCKIGNGRAFIAGSKNGASVRTFAKVVSPDTDKRYFIERGLVIEHTSCVI